MKLVTWLLDKLNVFNFHRGGFVPKNLEQNTFESVNANVVSKQVVDEWLIWCKSVFDTKGERVFHFDITNESWIGFDVLKEMILKKITEAKSNGK